MLGLYHVFTSGKMLSKHFTIIFILLTLLCKIRILNPHNLRLLLVIDLIELYFLKHGLCIIVFSFETRNKAIAIGFNNRNHDDIDQRNKDDCNCGKKFAITINRENDKG
jgi:hypothetical protein